MSRPFLDADEKAYDERARSLVTGNGATRTRDMIVAEVRASLANAYRDGLAAGRVRESQSASDRFGLAIDNAVRALEAARKVTP